MSAPIDVPDWTLSVNGLSQVVAFSGTPIGPPALVDVHQYASITIALPSTANATYFWADNAGNSLTPQRFFVTDTDHSSITLPVIAPKLSILSGFPVTIYGMNQAVSGLIVPEETDVLRNSINQAWAVNQTGNFFFGRDPYFPNTVTYSFRISDTTSSGELQFGTPLSPPGSDTYLFSTADLTTLGGVRYKVGTIDHPKNPSRWQWRSNTAATYAIFLALWGN